jgi:hypothetical protein
MEHIHNNLMTLGGSLGFCGTLPSDSPSFIDLTPEKLPDPIKQILVVKI